MLTCTQIIQTKRKKFLCKTTVLMCVSSFESFGPSSELDNDVCWKKNAMPSGPFTINTSRISNSCSIKIHHLHLRVVFI